MQENLKETLERMERLNNNDDTEANHHEADYLLIGLVEEMAEVLNVSEQANEIIKSYNDINKWYA